MESSTHDTVPSKTPLDTIDQADQVVSINFRRGIDRPHWTMVNTAYAEKASFLAAAPVFTSATAISYSLRLELLGATFEGAAGGPPRFNLFSGDASAIPIEVGTLDPGRTGVDVRWTAPPRDDAWLRWVFRFYVKQQTDGPSRPFPLAFVYLPPQSSEAREARATTTQPHGRRHDPIADAAITADDVSPTLCTTIRIVNGFPQYPRVFNYDEVTLPSGVYPDPMLTVLEHERAFSLRFTADSSTFKRGTATVCNPGKVDDAPLGLRFLGVNPVNPSCPPDDNVPRGFQNSVVKSSTRECVVSWNEPKDDRGAPKKGRVASFLFCNQEDNAMDDEDKALVDPTVITGLPENPPG